MNGRIHERNHEVPRRVAVFLRPLGSSACVYQVGCIDRSAGRVTVELAIKEGSCAVLKVWSDVQGAMTRRCGTGGTWTPWTGARCCARTARSMASTKSVCLGHQKCPVRVDQLKVQWIKWQVCGYRSRERFRKAIYFHLGHLDLYPRWLSTPNA